MALCASFLSAGATSSNRSPMRPDPVAGFRYNSLLRALARSREETFAKCFTSLCRRCSSQALAALTYRLQHAPFRRRRRAEWSPGPKPGARSVSLLIRTTKVSQLVEEAQTLEEGQVDKVQLNVFRSSLARVPSRVVQDVHLPVGPPCAPAPSSAAFRQKRFRERPRSQATMRKIVTRNSCNVSSRGWD